jgi:hypothetical protein
MTTHTSVLLAALALAASFLLGCVRDADDGSGTGGAAGSPLGGAAAAADASGGRPDTPEMPVGGAWVWPPAPGPAESTCGISYGDDDVGEPVDICRNTSFPEGGDCYTCAVAQCCVLLMCASKNTGVPFTQEGSRFEHAYRYVECVDECLAETSAVADEPADARLEACAETCARTHDFGLDADVMARRGTLFDARSLVRCLADLPLDPRVVQPVSDNVVPGGCPVCLPHL